MRGILKKGQHRREEETVDVDPSAMGVLIEESNDLHHDAMAATGTALDELVETGHESRAHGAIDPDESRLVAARRSQLVTGAAFGALLLAAGGFIFVSTHVKAGPLKGSASI